MAIESPFTTHGPDFEAYGQRYRNAVERVRRHQQPPRFPRREATFGELPLGCPLGFALGRAEPCLREGCCFYRVPGVRPACALRQWAPDVRTQPELARWFLRRRAEAAAEAEAAGRA